MMHHFSTALVHLDGMADIHLMCVVAEAENFIDVYVKHFYSYNDDEAQEFGRDRLSPLIHSITIQHHTTTH